MSLDYLSTLDKKLEELEASEQLSSQGYHYQYLGKVLHTSIICLLRDVITTFKEGQ